MEPHKALITIKMYIIVLSNDKMCGLLRNWMAVNSLQYFILPKWNNI